VGFFGDREGFLICGVFIFGVGLRWETPVFVERMSGFCQSVNNFVWILSGKIILIGQLLKDALGNDYIGSPSKLLAGGKNHI
jgi:hypothetical protein